jgi:hypothetical protein
MPHIDCHLDVVAHAGRFRCAAFYAAYPRKQAPDDAFKAWRKVINAGAKPAEIMAGLERYQFDPDPTYIKLPGGCLRAGNWKNQPAPLNQLSLVSPSNPSGREILPVSGGF